MALFEEQITDTIEAGAPSIKYNEGDIQRGEPEGQQDPQRLIAQQIWDELDMDQKAEFGTFEQFYTSGAWKQILAQMEQDEQQDQQGIGSLAPEMQQGMQQRMQPQPQQMAYGGMMGDDGRRAYGFGSFFKKIKRAAKKVFKSPLGKAALIGGLGMIPFGAAGTGLWSKLGAGLASKFGTGAASKWMGGMKGMPGVGQLWSPKAAAGKGLLSRIGGGIGSLFKNKEGTGFDPWKIAIGATSLAPLFGIGTKRKQDKLPDAGGKFGYDFGKMRDKFAKAQTEEDFAAAEEAYPDVTSNLFKSRFYDMNAEGGRIGLEDGGDPFLREEYEKYIFEMEEMGMEPMSFEQFKAQSRAGQAQGGRIEYAGGSGRPPITMGQPIQAPPQMPAQQRPNPMPAPQPNRMAGMNPMMGGMNPMMGGMNPMMNRPMMNPMMGGRRMAQEGGLMSLGGMEKDYRNDGGFVPLGAKEKADDVPARLSKNEFVFTADAVRGAGGGDVDQGAERMENMMKQFESRGKRNRAPEMFDISERLSEVL